MHTARYEPPKGQGSFQLAAADGSMKAFLAGKDVAVTPEEATRLKGHKYFKIDGKPAAFYGMLADNAAPNGGRAPEDNGRPQIPAKGFSRKEDAVVFAKTHFNHDLKEGMALKTMNDTIVRLYNERYGVKEDGGQGVPTDAGSDSFMDTGGKVEI